MQIQPYLFFNGRAEEAIDFYRTSLGAEVGMLMRFKESPEAGMVTPGTEEKVMHAALRIGDSTVLLSDGRCSGSTSFEGSALSIYAKDDAEARRFFEALAADDGQVQMSLTRTFFASSFGMVADRFGVGWMVVTVS
jgi:PhnB protein